jgi:ribosomal protein S18 acetylase RimI-like enzyme
MIECRFLNEGDFVEVVKTMQAGFSDYFVKFKLAQEGYRKKFVMDGVDLNCSVGVFCGGEMAGVVVNASRIRDGLPELYNAGTAVKPEHRRKGCTTMMLDYSLPILRERGFGRYVLEVLAKNDPAISLYKKFGFQATKGLGVFSQTDVRQPVGPTDSVEIRSLTADDVDKKGMFDDCGIAWQNSNDGLRNALREGLPVKIATSRAKGVVNGFGVVHTNGGKVARVCVDEAFRRNGVASSILESMAAMSEKPLNVLNIDMANKGAVALLEANNFKLKLEQHEMELDLRGI